MTSLPHRPTLTSKGLAFLLPALLGTLAFLYWDLHRGFNAAAGLGIALLLLGLSRRPVASVWGTLWLLIVIAYASKVRMAYLGTPLTILDLRIVATAPEIIANYDWPPAAFALLVLFAIVLLGWREKPLALGFGQRLGTMLGSALLCGGIALAAARDPLPPYRYAGGYPPGKAATRILIGSIFDVSTLKLPAAEGSNSYCCAHHSAAVLQADWRQSERPDLIIVLLESSFDPALSLTPDIAHKVPPLPGERPLHVHTAGGETWSAEYAVLHGVAHPVYGPSGIYINFLGPGQLDGALPQILRSAGYSTSTVASTDADFYGSARFHTSLGMQQFDDCAHRPDCQGRPWPEISDRQAYERILKRLEDHPEQPHFVFSTTIRQHSPHVQRGPSGGALDSDPNRVMQGVLEEFGRRQALSVAELQWFAEALKQRKRPSLLIAFGDHVPSDVNRYFPEARFADRHRTHYTVFDTSRGWITADLEKQLGVSKDLDVAQIDVLALQALRIHSRYGDDKAAWLRQTQGAYPISELTQAR